MIYYFVICLRIKQSRIEISRNGLRGENVSTS